MTSETIWIKWEGPKWLPVEFEGSRDEVVAEIQKHLDARFDTPDFGVDAMTDQIDVYRKGRILARYMP